MNITELARILKITPQELRDNLPKLGFDIGQKAIKINRNVANKIIKEWPKLRRQLDFQKRQAEREEKEKQQVVREKKKIRIPKLITVKEFAQMADVQISTLLSALMKNGIFTSLNEKIDFETAWLVGSELNVEVKLKKTEVEEEKNRDNKLKTILENETKKDLLDRPPVIVVMGHVDHGKTKLLDAIRKSDVVAGEAGGITQHIGAYQVRRKNQVITFVDTPGHEAFTAMRSRGAKIADIAILVVAADDGVKPQTIEAFRIIEAAKIPYVVAINKIDKPEANIDKTKQELSSQLNIVPEDWGGKTVCIPISALKSKGISELLDMVLLVANTEADQIKANPNTTAIGTIIESNIDKGAGPIATLLVQNGTLKVGDNLMFENTHFGKARALHDYRGRKIEEATPATPVQIIGLKTMPHVGDILEVGTGKKVNLRKAKQIVQKPSSVHSISEVDDSNVKKITVIIRSDVLGSAEAIEESLAKINTKEVRTKVIHKGLGNITDGDIKRAEASSAIILGFNVKTPIAIEEIAREKNIVIKHYSIIYDLINDMKKEMQELVEPETVRTKIGRLKVQAIFKTEKKSQIVGGRILEGTAIPDAIIEVERKGELLADGVIAKLQAGKQEVSIVEENQECGILYEGNPIIEEGDILNLYKEEKIINKL